MNEQRTPRTNDPQNKRPSLARIAGCVMMGLAAMLAMGLVFWLLWSRVAVPLLACPPLTFLQGLGAFLLSALLVFMVRHVGCRHGADSTGHRSHRCFRPRGYGPDRAGSA